MIRHMIGYAAVVYGIMIPICSAYVYFHTDYSKIKASPLVKLEVTILLGFVWPIVVLYVIKQEMLRRRSGRDS